MAAMMGSIPELDVLGMAKSTIEGRNMQLISLGMRLLMPLVKFRQMI